jgi:Spy/CpxP family protein refolding chaperone
MSKLLIALILIGGTLVAQNLTAQEQEGSSAPRERSADTRPEGGRGFRGGGGGRFGNRMMGMVPLLQIDSIKKELKIEGDKATEVESFTVKIREDFADEVRDVMDSLRNANPEDRQQFREKMAEVANRINERLSTVLDEEQTSRLRQINLQLGLRRDGAAQALSSSDIAAALDLTSEQQEQLREQARESRGGRGRTAKSLAEAREEANAVLTPEQQEKLTNLLGAEFNLPEAMLEGGRGRGGFGGRRGGGEGRRSLRQRPESEQDAAPAEAI